MYLSLREITSCRARYLVIGGSGIILVMVAESLRGGLHSAALGRRSGIGDAAEVDLAGKYTALTVRPARGTADDLPDPETEK